MDSSGSGKGPVGDYFGNDSKPQGNFLITWVHWSWLLQALLYRL